MKLYKDKHTAEVIRERLEKGKGIAYTTLAVEDGFVVLPATEAEGYKHPTPTPPEPQVPGFAKIKQKKSVQTLMEQYNHGDSAAVHAMVEKFYGGNPDLTAEELKELYDDTKPVMTVGVGDTLSNGVKLPKAPEEKAVVAAKMFSSIYPWLEVDVSYDLEADEWGFDIKSQDGSVHDIHCSTSLIKQISAANLVETISGHCPTSLLINQGGSTFAKIKSGGPNMQSPPKKGTKMKNIVPGSAVPPSITIKLSEQSTSKLAEFSEKFDKLAKEAMALPPSLMEGGMDVGAPIEAHYIKMLMEDGSETALKVTKPMHKHLAKLMNKYVGIGPIPVKEVQEALKPLVVPGTKFGGFKFSGADFGEIEKKVIAQIKEHAKKQVPAPSIQHPGKIGKLFPVKLKPGQKANIKFLK